MQPSHRIQGSLGIGRDRYQFRQFRQTPHAPTGAPPPLAHAAPLLASPTAALRDICIASRLRTRGVEEQRQRTAADGRARLRLS